MDSSSWGRRMLPHVAVSALLRSIRRIVASMLLALLVLAGIGGLVVVQAGRDEATSADTALVMLVGEESGQAARINRAVRLYLGGQVSHLVLAGSDPTGVRETLVARGVVQDKITEIRQPTQIEQIRATEELFQKVGIADAMLVGEPVEALRLLKIARDHGLVFRSAPTGADTTIDLGNVIDEVGRYMSYCFLGR